MKKIRITEGCRLPDDGFWVNRFSFSSTTSNATYVISQNVEGRYWGCSCPGWRNNRKCKHLTVMGLPNHMVQLEAVLESSTPMRIEDIGRERQEPKYSSAEKLTGLGRRRIG